jgi:hypothetical protein
MGTAAATSTKRVYQRSGIKQRWFTKMMRQIQIKAAGNRRFFRPQNLPTDMCVLHTDTCVLFSSSRPNIRIHNLADWRTLVYGLPAMTAKQREDVRHKGIRKDLFTSLHAEAGYIVFDPVRPIPERTSEQKVSALFASTFDLGENIYLLYGRKRRVWCDNPDATRAIEQAERCMDRKMRFTLADTNAEGSPESPMTKPGKKYRNQGRLRETRTDNHDRTLWERTWTGNPEWTARRLPASSAEILMLPLSQRIGWRRRRPRESGWSKQVKCIKHPQ